MRDLLYVPPRAHDGSTALGLVGPDLRRPMQVDLVEAVQERAAVEGFALAICVVAATGCGTANCLYRLVEAGISAYIVFGDSLCEAGARAPFAQLLRGGKSIVVLGSTTGRPGGTAVGVDEREVGRVACRHLVELGHRSLAFVGTKRRLTSTNERAEGAQMALSGVPGATLEILAVPPTLDGGAAALECLSRMASRPTAAVCAVDSIATGVVVASRSFGIRIPADLSIVACEAPSSVAFSDPLLTHVAHPIWEIAHAAVSVALGQLRQPKREWPLFLFRPRLTLGGSTAPIEISLWSRHSRDDSRNAVS